MSWEANIYISTVSRPFKITFHQIEVSSMCIYNSWCMFIYFIYFHILYIDICHICSVVLNIFDLDNSEIQKPLSSPPPPKKKQGGVPDFFLAGTSPKSHWSWDKTLGSWDRQGFDGGGDGHDVVHLFVGLTRLKVKKLTRRRWLWLKFRKTCV